MAADEGGMRLYSSLTGGGAGSMPNMEFKIVSAESQEFFQGDPVQLEDAGTLATIVGDAEVGVVGIFQGCEYTDSDGQRQWSNKYNITITEEDTVAFVSTDPFALYKIRIGVADANSTLTLSAIGACYDYEYLSGNATTGMSGYILDTASGAVSTGQIKIVGLSNDDGTRDSVGSASKTFTHAIVMIDQSVSFWLGVGVVS